MARRQTIIFTTGLAGSGKTYVRGTIEVFRFLLNEPGRFITNFPLKVHEIAEECQRRSGKDASHFASRIVVIPKAVLDGWMHIWPNHKAENSRGIWTLLASIPWDEWLNDQGRSWKGWQKYENNELSEVYSEWIGSFCPEIITKTKDDDGNYWATPDINEAHIAIDEIHNFCSASGRTPKQQRIKWQQFLGEIRHMGATIEFITQNKDKVADEIQGEAHINIELVNSDSLVDPVFKIKLIDWYELIAGFTKVYEQRVRQIQKRKNDRKWEKVEEKTFVIKPENFKYYDSFAKPHGGGASGRGVKHIYETHSMLGVIWWFLRNNLSSLAMRFIVLLFVIWLCFGGGIKAGSKVLVGMFSKMSPIKSPVSASIVTSGPKAGLAKPTINTGQQMQKKIVYKIPEDVKEKLAEYEKLKRDIRNRLSVLFITPEVVILGDYKEYRVGDEIKMNNKSYEIIELDIKRRCVNLNPEKILYMK